MLDILNVAIFIVISLQFVFVKVTEPLAYYHYQALSDLEYSRGNPVQHSPIRVKIETDKNNVTHWVVFQINLGR